MRDTKESVLSDEHKQLLIGDGWKFWGRPPSCDVHDEYWTRDLIGVRRCANNPDKPMFVELQVFALRTFPREPELGVQLVLSGVKRDGRCVNLMAYGMPKGVDLTELEEQTAQLVAAWEAMDKVVDEEIT